MAPVVEVRGSVATYATPSTMAADDSTVVLSDCRSGAGRRAAAARRERDQRGNSAAPQPEAAKCLR